HVLERQRSQDEEVHEAEDQRVHADGEGDRQRRDRGERTLTGERSQAETQILKDRFHAWISLFRENEAPALVVARKSRTARLTRPPGHTPETFAGVGSMKGVCRRAPRPGRTS